tara:strand:+ start:182414 stop:183175 length:762 start_codon:yes stop_codon:yes gene_type:complete
MQVTYERETNLNQAVIKALALHIALVLIFLILGKLDFQITPDAIEIEETIQSSVKVDVVGMPKLTVQELKEFKATEIEKGETEDPKNIAEEKVEEPVEEKVDLGNLLSNLSKKKVAPKKRKKKKKFGNVLSQKELKSLVLEGNKISQGESVVGDSLENARTVLGQYASTLPSHVRPFWKLPSYLLNKDLSARIRVYLSETGKVLRTEIIKSSGVDDFDQRALRAIKQANPFPAPESEIAKLTTSGAIVLGFPL